MSTPWNPSAVTLSARRCPTSVVVASWLLAAMALLLVAEMVSVAYGLATLHATVHRVGPGVGATSADMDGLVRSTTSAFVFMLALLFGFVAVTTLAAVYARLGRRSGQVIGIAIAVPLLSCLPANFLPIGETRLESAVVGAQPGWADAIDLAALAVTPIAIAVIVLLLTGAARAFFAKLPPAPAGYMWVPAQAGDDVSGWLLPGQREQR